MSETEIIETPAGPAKLQRTGRRTLAIHVLPDGSLELTAPQSATADSDSGKSGETFPLDRHPAPELSRNERPARTSPICFRRDASLSGTTVSIENHPGRDRECSLKGCLLRSGDSGGRVGSREAAPREMVPGESGGAIRPADGCLEAVVHEAPAGRTPFADPADAQALGQCREGRAHRSES